MINRRSILAALGLAPAAVVAQAHVQEPARVLSADAHQLLRPMMYLNASLEDSKRLVNKDYSHRFSMMQDLRMTPEELLENERMWAEEKRAIQSA